ncbi:MULTISPECIES: TetR/AcrR family transcriptional regulator [unclassified Nocardia]|uniref:TetR/AcrR family transcriptional regulator n=1 Tax=unclassified Nocardia TaxID=2637762 RepID=UPI001CE417BB|nr:MULTISPECIES: TetR/AcrR family transcriptional regulator [unclassified Nocardia]
MPDPTPTDGRRIRGERTRTAVLDAAVRLASTDGLGGLSLAQLASGLTVSKSALFTHWPDKQALQLAAVDHAAEQWAEQVVRPALADRTGVRALWALAEHRLDFYRKPVLPGRCFFVTTQAEFDDHPGPVRDRLRTHLRTWDELTRNLIRQAIQAGELNSETDPALLSYEIDALTGAVVVRSHLLDEDTFALARTAVLARLRGLGADPALLPKN